MKWIGPIIGLLGLFTGYYYHASSQKHIDPTFVANPSTRQTILKQDANGAAPIKITSLDGTAISGNVYSETFHFFNQGKLPIKRDQVLEPLAIVLADSVSRILDFKILKESRSVAGIELWRDTLVRNRISVDFRILEANDGFTGQIIYSSTANPELKIEGAIEGAPQGFSNHYKGEWPSFSLLLSVIFNLAVTVASGMFLLALVKLLLKGRKEAVKQSGVDAQHMEHIGAEKRTLSSALNTRYQVVIHNENDYSERTSFRFTYIRLIFTSLLFFFATLGVSLFLAQTVLKRWVHPIYLKQPTPVSLPETLSVTDISNPSPIE